MKATVIKPGLLVSLSTRVEGGVAYRRVDLEPEHTDESGAKTARWETTKHIEDPAAYEKANATRGKARSMITAVCSASSFGLLCPSDREDDLLAAVAAARALADEHNAGSAVRVEVYALLGRVAQDDAEAARAIASEMRGLMDDMLDGVKQADPEAIRSAANKARAVGAMLSADKAKSVDAAIEQARKVARDLVKRVAKAGEVAADVVAEARTAEIEKARFAFLDLDEPASVEQQEVSARPIDLAPVGKTQGAASAAPQMEV